MIKFAIAGSHSFIATHLAHKLRQQEYQPIGVPRPLLYNLQALEDFFYKAKPDFIVNCASYGNLYYQDNDFETFYSNAIIPMNLMQASKNTPYKGFINFSSSSAGLPYETFYSAGKASGERLVRAFANKYDKPVMAIRPYTVIGPGEQPEHLIPTLIRSCLQQKEMNFVPDSAHDYIGVEDLCDAIIDLTPFIDKLKGQVIDIGTGKSTTNDEVRKIVEKVTGKKAIIKIVNSMRPYDTKDWKADMVILDYLGWKPQQSLEEIIRAMVNVISPGHR